jgi:hypothetical protein
VGAVQGLDYSNGDDMTLRIYVASNSVGAER